MDNTYDALATHVMLDPKIQQRIFEVLSNSLFAGAVAEVGPNGEHIYITAPVNEFVRSLFMNRYFDESLRGVIRHVVHEAMVGYNAARYPGQKIY